MNHLTTVLSFGSLRSYSLDELINETEVKFATPGHESLDPIGVELASLRTLGQQGRICFEFAPYNDNNPADLDKTRMWVYNASELVNYMFAQYIHWLRK